MHSSTPLRSAQDDNALLSFATGISHKRDISLGMTKAIVFSAICDTHWPFCFPYQISYHCDVIVHLMRISVIIPVFNAAKFLEEAVRSALDQTETLEVILIEDGSTDDSLSVCKTLSSADPRVKLLIHEDNKNLGPSASRNLGMRYATGDYIAFLDADDVYLPSRFTTMREVFQTHRDADGVYETIGTMYMQESLRVKHLDRVRRERTGLSVSVSPHKLFDVLATGKYGHLHLDGLVIQKRALNTDLEFDPSLRQAQDSDWILRIASCRRLYPGNVDKLIAMRRVHAENRVLNTPEAIQSQRQYLYKCISNHFYGSKNRYSKLYITARYVSWIWEGKLRRMGMLSGPAILLATAIFLICHPVLLFRILFK